MENKKLKRIDLCEGQNPPRAPLIVAREGQSIPYGKNPPKSPVVVIPQSVVKSQKSDKS